MVGDLKFALYGLHREADGPEALAGRARAAEEAGFEGLWVGDHVACRRVQVTNHGWKPWWP